MKDIFACGEKINCSNQSRLYQFCCNDNKIRTFGATDPFHFDGGDFNKQYSPFTLLKLNSNAIPLCLEIDTANQGPNIKIQSDICGGGVCSSGDIYDPNDLYYDMKQAENMWKCICGWDSNSCGCTVKVSFVDINRQYKNLNYQIFAEPKSQYGTNSVELSQLLDKNDIDEGRDVKDINTINNCEIQCNDLHIYLNNTPEYTRCNLNNQTPDNMYSSFYVSHSIVDNWNYKYWGAKVPSSPNLRTVLAYELGQLYGFEYENGTKLTNGSELNGIDCSSGSLFSLRPDNSNPLEYATISDEEKCAFISLYCPEINSVNENNQNSKDVIVYPNPVAGKISFQFYANDIYSNAIIIISDVSGKIISNTNIQDINLGENNIVIDNLNLANGSYYFQIILNTQILKGKFLIQK
jgi:hypothetical protein